MMIELIKTWFSRKVAEAPRKNKEAGENQRLPEFSNSDRIFSFAPFAALRETDVRVEI